MGFGSNQKWANYKGIKEIEGLFTLNFKNVTFFKNKTIEIKTKWIVE
jgi:hypothetical protein